MFDLQKFSVTESVSVAISWRTTGGKTISRKFSYINPSATDEQLSNFAKALTRLTTSTYVTTQKTLTYDVEQAIEDEEG